MSDDQRHALEQLKHAIVVSVYGRAFWKLAALIGRRPRNPQVRRWLAEEKIER